MSHLPANLLELRFQHFCWNLRKPSRVLEGFPRFQQKCWNLGREPCPTFQQICWNFQVPAFLLEPEKTFHRQSADARGRKIRRRRKRKVPAASRPRSLVWRTEWRGKGAHTHSRPDFILWRPKVDSGQECRRRRRPYLYLRKTTGRKYPSGFEMAYQANIKWIFHLVPISFTGSPAVE